MRNNHKHLESTMRQFCLPKWWIWWMAIAYRLVLQLFHVQWSWHFLSCWGKKQSQIFLSWLSFHNSIQWSKWLWLKVKNFCPSLLPSFLQIHSIQVLVCDLPLDKKLQLSFIQRILLFNLWDDPAFCLLAWLTFMSPSLKGTWNCILWYIRRTTCLIQMSLGMFDSCFCNGKSLIFWWLFALTWSCFGGQQATESLYQNNTLSFQLKRSGVPKQILFTRFCSFYTNLGFQVQTL